MSWNEKKITGIVIFAICVVIGAFLFSGWVSYQYEDRVTVIELSTGEILEYKYSPYSGFVGFSPTIYRVANWDGMEGIYIPNQIIKKVYVK